MKKRFFRRWNWEYDFGEEELRHAPKPNSAHAVAFYDGQGRLFRVEVTEQIGVSDGNVARFIYDYFCDDEGRVMEKRSLDELGAVILIVRFVHEAASQQTTQIAFYPESGETRLSVSKNYLIETAKRCQVSTSDKVGLVVNDEG